MPKQLQHHSSTCASIAMNRKKQPHLRHALLLCISCLVGLVGLNQSVHADGLFSKTSQKQWVGQSAPAFQLLDQNSKPHRLSDYKGKWLVLYFYPKDDTAGCTAEANQFKALYPQFLKRNTAVLGVSMDDVKSHQAFSKKLGLPFPILADNKGVLAGQFGIVRNLGITKMAKRESFLIDPKGAIVYHYTSVNAQTHAADILKDLQRFQAKK